MAQLLGPNRVDRWVRRQLGAEVAYNIKIDGKAA